MFFHYILTITRGLYEATVRLLRRRRVLSLHVHTNECSFIACSQQHILILVCFLRVLVVYTCCLCLLARKEYAFYWLIGLKEYTLYWFICLKEHSLLWECNERVASTRRRFVSFVSEVCVLFARWLEKNTRLSSFLA